MDQRADDVEIREVPAAGARTDEALPGLRDARSEYVQSGRSVSRHDDTVRIETTGASRDHFPSRMDAATTDAHTSDDPNEIRNDIEETRAQMSETINAIEDRLSPRHLKDEAKDAVAQSVQQAKDSVRDATIGRVEAMVNNTSNSARGAGNTFITTIRENPVPAALAAIGIGWLISKGRSTAKAQSTTRYPTSGIYTYNGGQHRLTPGNPTYPYSPQGYPNAIDYSAGGLATSGYRSSDGPNVGDRLQDRAGQVTGSVQNAASQATDRVQQAAGQVSDQVQSMASQASGQVQNAAEQFSGQAQYQTQRAQSWFQRQLDENPLMLGAAALAAGVLVGLSVPETPQEDRVLGPARDTLVQRAEGVAQDTVQRVQSVAKSAGAAAKDAAQDEAQNQGLPTPGTSSGQQSSQSQAQA